MDKPIRKRPRIHGPPAAPSPVATEFWSIAPTTNNWGAGATAQQSEAVEQAKNAYVAFTGVQGQKRSEIESKIRSENRYSGPRTVRRLGELNTLKDQYWGLRNTLSAANQASVEPYQLELHGLRREDVVGAIQARLEENLYTRLEIITGSGHGTAPGAMDHNRNSPLKQALIAYFARPEVRREYSCETAPAMFGGTSYGSFTITKRKAGDTGKICAS
jgi:hypothetical protein